MLIYRYKYVVQILYASPFSPFGSCRQCGERVQIFDMLVDLMSTAFTRKSVKVAQLTTISQRKQTIQQCQGTVSNFVHFLLHASLTAPQI